MRAAALVARAMLLIGAGALAVPASLAWSAENEVEIRAGALEPHVLRAVAGERVNFVKRVGHPVHVEFGEDPGHQVFHVPAAAPIWAIFHRPGVFRARVPGVLLQERLGGRAGRMKGAPRGSDMAPRGCKSAPRRAS